MPSGATPHTAEYPATPGSSQDPLLQQRMRDSAWDSACPPPPGPYQLLDSSTAMAATGHPHAKAGWYMLLGTVVSVDSVLALYVSHYSFTSKWDNRDPLSLSSTLT